MRALALAQVPLRWYEWSTADAGCPDYVHRFGSPTVLIDGHDVGGTTAGVKECCRLYPSDVGGLVGAPSVETILRSLRYTRDSPAASKRPSFGWRGTGAILPSLGVALLPKIACPACWPAYAGILSSLGVSFLIDTRYLFVLTTAFLVAALVLLGFRARRRRGYPPLFAGAAASLLILTGKFYAENELVMFGGVGLLMLASIWNSWPRGAAADRSCPACIPTPATANAPATCCEGATKGVVPS